MRSVENEECRKCGVWKMRSVENAECRKCGVWKMRSEKKNQLSISISHFSVENEACVIWKVTNDR